MARPSWFTRAPTLNMWPVAATRPPGSTHSSGRAWPIMGWVSRTSAVPSPRFTPLRGFAAAGELIRAVQELSLARSLEDIQAVVRAASRRMTGADGATFVLLDQDFCYYADEDAIAPLWKGQRFPLETCLS